MILKGHQWAVADSLSDALLSSRVDLSRMHIQLGADIAALLVKWKTSPTQTLAIEIADVLLESVSEAAWAIAAMRANEWDAVPGIDDLEDNV